MSTIKTVMSVATPSARVSQKPWLTCSAPGTYKTGQTVTCHPGEWTGASLTLAYQWVRDAADIAGETAATHILVLADETHTISCRVTGTPADALYKAHAETTPPSIVVTP